MTCRQSWPKKGRGEKHDAMRRALALMQFMVDNELIRFDPYYSNGPLQRDVVVVRLNRTEEGRLSCRRSGLNGGPGWIAGGDPFQTDMLDRRLKALRDRHTAD